MMRFGYGRMHEVYLYRVTRRSSLWLATAQIVLALVTISLRSLPIKVGLMLLLMSVIQLLVAVAGLLFIIKNLATSRPAPLRVLSDKQLPTLTVAIPARNETQDLAECLDSFIASSYQKLEILVLDDCSQDKTSEVIKQFAHDGVRFIRGDEPGDTWLAKNAAYEKLAHEASSELILFCGVDVRVQPNTLKNLVSYMVQSKASMVSMLPLRDNNAPAATITQHIRYLWELALPRFLTKRPPVLSTLWLVDKTEFNKLGGMAAVKRTIVPEGYFARELVKQYKYQFLRANTELAVTSLKSAKGQRKTALRVRYPQLHRRPEVALLVIAAELTAIISVPVVLGIGLHFAYTGVVPVTIVALLLHLVCLIVMAQSYSKSQLVLHVIQGIFAVPLDTLLILKSMYMYEFSEMYWKERNVCLPVMHVVPNLPKLP